MYRGRTKAVLGSVARFVRSSKKTIPLILIVVVATIATSTIISILLSRTTRLYVPSLGTIKTIGVDIYWDEALTNKTESVNWSTIYVGSSQNVTFYLRSISNAEATLHLNATDWNPSDISKYMTLSWNYNGSTLQPGQVIQVTLTLSASSSYAFIYYLITQNVKRFSFDITIAASEQS
jgi:hypothetical protein